MCIASRPQESVPSSGRQEYVNQDCGAECVNQALSKSIHPCADSMLTKQVANEVLGFLATMMLGKGCLR